MKYKVRMFLGQRVVDKTLISKGQLNPVEIKQHLDKIYFNNLTDCYPAARAIVVSTCPPTTHEFTRIEGANATGMWK